MSFLDNLTNKVTNTVNNIGNKVAEKTTSTTENFKLSSAIKEEENQINEDYIAIGKKYRELFGSAPAPEFAEYIADIERREQTVIENRKKIQLNKGKITCANCGAEIDNTALFCTKCGTKNPVAEEISKQKAEAAARAAAEAAAKAQAEAEAKAQAAQAKAQAEAQAAAAQAAAAEFQAKATAEAVANTDAVLSPAADAPVVHCSNCGNVIAPGNVFCTNCGTRAEQ